jgi:hypothetical protein
MRMFTDDELLHLINSPLMVDLRDDVLSNLAPHDPRRSSSSNVQPESVDPSLTKVTSRDLSLLPSVTDLVFTLREPKHAPPGLVKNIVLDILHRTPKLERLAMECFQDHTEPLGLPRGRILLGNLHTLELCNGSVFLPMPYLSDIAAPSLEGLILSRAYTLDSDFIPIFEDFMDASRCRLKKLGLHFCIGPGTSNDYRRIFCHPGIHETLEFLKCAEFESARVPTDPGIFVALTALTLSAHQPVLLPNLTQIRITLIPYQREQREFDAFILSRGHLLKKISITLLHSSDMIPASDSLNFIEDSLPRALQESLRRLSQNGVEVVSEETDDSESDEENEESNT